MKKFLLLFAILFAFPCSASTIPEGTIVKTISSPDVYIVKYQNGGEYRRLVLNPLVFQSYGHLKWENLLTISDSEMASFSVSNLVKVDGSSDIYELTPTGDNGTKQKLSSNWGVDLDSVYIINVVDFGNYADNGVKHVVSKEEAQATEDKQDAEDAAAKLEAERIAKEKEVALIAEIKLESQKLAISKIVDIVRGYNQEISDIDTELDEEFDKSADLSKEYSDVKDLTESKMASYYATQLYYSQKKRMGEYVVKLSVINADIKSLDERKQEISEKRDKMTAVYYEVEDYMNYGKLVPAVDRAYLLSLGIDFRC